MGNTDNQRDRIWEIARILWENTSEGIEEPIAIPLSTILEKLAEKDIQANRETIYKDLNFLCACMGVEKHPGKPMKYSMGKHFFDVEELLLLSVAAASSPFLTDISREKILGNLRKLDAQPITERLFASIQVDKAEGTQADNTYYALMALQETLKEPLPKRHNVSFVYKRISYGKTVEAHNNGERYVVFPIRIMYANDFFYLLAYLDYEGINHRRLFRIDGIYAVEPQEKEAEWDSATKKEIKELDEMDYSVRAYDAFLGEEAGVTLSVHKKLLQSVVDKFGMNYTEGKRSGDRVNVHVRAMLNPPFFGWLAAHASTTDEDSNIVRGIELLKPENAVEKYHEFLAYATGEAFGTR